MSDVNLVFLMLTLNILHTFSRVSIAYFKQENVCGSASLL